MTMETLLIFITGGARSGKSLLGESLSLEINRLLGENSPVAYIATAEAMDGEFRRRIELHRARRGDRFTAFEEPLDIAGAVRSTLKSHNVFLLECATTWLGNVFHKMGNDNAGTFLDDTLKKLMEVLGKNYQSENNDYASLMKSDGIFKGQYCKPLYKLVDGTAGAMIVVSNELGLGIVPADRVSREYRDLHGIMNARLAGMADAAFFTVSGIPVRIK